MITADSLVAHAVGDYLLQSDWMATSKTSKSTAALAHVTTYALPFLFLTRSPMALAFIVVTHFLIDRWRLSRYVVWAKNFIAPPRVKREKQISGTQDAEKSVPPTAMQQGFLWVWYERRNPPWSEVKDSFGYPKDRPVWLTMWLLIIADNTMHVLLNGVALTYLQ